MGGWYAASGILVDHQRKQVINNAIIHKTHESMNQHEQCVLLCIDFSSVPRQSSMRASVRVGTFEDLPCCDSGSLAQVTSLFLCDPEVSRCDVTCATIKVHNVLPEIFSE